MDTSIVNNIGETVIIMIIVLFNLTLLTSSLPSLKSLFQLTGGVLLLYLKLSLIVAFSAMLFIEQLFNRTAGRLGIPGPL